MAEGWNGLAVHHVLTRSVRDSAAALDVTAGPDVGAPYYAVPPARPYLEEVGADPGRLRVAFAVEPPLPAQVHADCVAGVYETARLCEDLGHDVVAATFQIDGEAFVKAFVTMACADTRAGIAAAERRLGRKATAADFEPQTWCMALLGEQFTAADLAEAVELLKLTGRQVGKFFAEVDVLLTPTLAMPPLPIGALQPRPHEVAAMQVLGRLNAGRLLRSLSAVSDVAAATFAFMPFTPVFNATGQPAMSVPLVWNEEGLPIGMQFVGRYGDEARLFRLAGQLEQARPWGGRIPPVHA